MEILKDSFGRKHTYLRISLTDNCNLRCFYCMPEEDYAFTPPAKLMSPEEILHIARVFVDAGVTKIRLTGGEPLIRKDAGKILESLGALPVELAITTNGARIHEFIDNLTSCGIKTVNVSLDTLQPEKFNFITRRNIFHLVKSNIELLLHHNFIVKVNVVVMKGLNDNEIIDFIEWTRHVPVQIRFIEFMPFSGNRWTSNKVVSLDEILRTVSSAFEFLPVATDIHDTAKHFMIPGHEGSFSIISTMTSPFCGGCNRIRLTADGKLKNCLFSSSETDLLTAYRNGQMLEPLIHENIFAKAKELGGQFVANLDKIDAGDIQNRSMITIGG